MALFESVIRYSFSDFCTFTSSGIYKPTGPLMQAHRLPYASPPAPLMQAHQLPYASPPAPLWQVADCHKPKFINS